MITHDDRYLHLADQLIGMEHGKLVEEMSQLPNAQLTIAA